MISLRYISRCDVCHTYRQGVIIEILIPLFGISVGIIVPLAVFYWQYHETKHKNETIIEISKNIDDPSKLEDLLHMLDERKKDPIDYRRGGIITILWVLVSAFLVMLRWDLSLWVLDIW